MNRINSLTALALIAAALTVATRVNADTPSPAAKEFTLTDENLKDKLEDMGFEVKVEKTGNTFFYTINLKHNARNYSFWSSISPDKSVFWINQTLVKFPPIQSNAARLMKLLTNNSDSGLNFFKYVTEHKALTMTRGIANKALTTRSLRDQIDSFVSTIESTRADWDVAWDKPAETTRRRRT